MTATFLGTILALALGAVQPNGPPKLPYSDPGACPFECCQYGEWTSRAAQRVHTEMRRGAPVAFTLRPDEKVQAVTGVVVTTKLGIVIVQKKTAFYDISVPGGSKLFVLHSLGEGAYLFWYKGAPHKGELYAETVHKGNTQYPWDVLSVPEGEWWVKVRNQHGATGWLLNPHGFRGMDACGN